MTGGAWHGRGEDLGDLRIRRSRHEDLPALRRLAQLDSACYPAGEHLVAEEGGELRAALPLAGGRPIADPFHPTADLVAMLALRAQRLHAAEPPAGSSRGLRTPVRRRSRARATDRSRQGLVARPGHP